MAGDFIAMVTRITTELRRSNLTNEAKQAVNDAVKEAAKTRFHFNELRGKTFNTVVGQEYYPDLGLVEIDTLYYMQGTSRFNLEFVHNDEIDDFVSSVGGLPEIYSREGSSLRIYPVPGVITTLTLDGFGQLTPSPLVNDADTNEWMTTAERYVRALAKSILLKDVILDYGESAVYEVIAEDLKQQLLSEYDDRRATGRLRSTCW